MKARVQKHNTDEVHDKCEILKSPQRSVFLGFKAYANGEPHMSPPTYLKIDSCCAAGTEVDHHRL